MATPIDDELSQIGKALAAAADGEPVALTDDQREVLARAAFPDMLDAILAHAPVHSNTGATDPIARAWSDELCVAFRSQSITDKVAEDSGLQTILSVVSQDDRLSSEEKQKLSNAVTDYPQGPDGSRSTLSQLPARPRQRAYLASIAVEGFRGIGPRSDLPLEPQPGLTLIYGANGSGKSTFVEALDVLLTGSTARFAGRGREWRSAWANAHSPDRGQIDVEFVVEAPIGARRYTSTRDWTAADLSTATDKKDNSLWGPVQTIGTLIVSGGAIDEFRPILGYGELGPLFDESGSLDDPHSGYVTPFAQHIRARANIRDGVTDTLWDLIRDYEHHTAFYRELAAWQSCVSEARKGAMRKSSLRSVVMGDAPAAGTLRLPSDWNWRVLTKMRTRTFSDSHDKDRLLEVARAYSSRFSAPIRELLARFAVQSRREDEALLFGEHHRATLHDYALARESRRFLEYAPRVRSYAEMLLDEIHSARLEQFSQRVSDFWQEIRRGSDVRFEALSLQQHRPIDKAGSPPALELRVSLDLTIDGDRPIERGALSQGELHSLALSVFLPTLMMPGSPFGFAVVDDPVQAMDSYAVDGLAEVLRHAAEELQVVVFTHDERLVRAVQLLGFDHTRIDVTRYPGSVVHCEVAYDPALEALDLARIEAALPVDEDRWTIVAFHCRHAVEHACIAAGRRKLRAASMSLADIRDALDEPKQHELSTTRRLMAIAIWGQAVRWQEVRKHVVEDEKEQWGEWVEGLIERLNVLVHDDDENKVEAARTAYPGGLEELISKSAQLVEKIGENCV